ncbi:DNA ligase D [Parapedobacter koreensis]|uniref:DNA ligase (ATP) n=1 Tax=Parapedobacter koreensis TaxID=332977 RepID=A0A1H7MAU2_9SPHI|nr:DNA ligase D [Parapedobacter koreensis]SEL08199.1 bifunctional non-homologous end joining protein LigD [Parapedobacter koreensis]
MALTEYKRKRAFGETLEPTGGKAATKGLLRFVIQKHEASRLHYDFRLELRGVLKSWAVPKGPSLNPADKRLAMEVEDHPYDYKDFEGIIPKGNYGAGTVMIWDEGTYEPIGQFKNKTAQENALLKQLKAGSMKFTLHGKKLNGEFALVRTKGMADNSWLLIKHKDQYAAIGDITTNDTSVKSGKTLEKIAKTPAAIVSMLRKAKKASFPTSLSPMLATLVDVPFDDAGWEYEIKWDGYRALAFMNKGKVTLKSRKGNSFDERFYPVLDAVKAWGIQAVVDGEIVVVSEEGLSSFNRLQNWRNEADGDLFFYVFDLLWYQGKDLTVLPLKERKAILATLIPSHNLIRSGYSIAAKGTEFFDAAHKLGLEGVIAKRSDSLYYPGERSKDWLKIKIQKRQEVIICGYTKNEGTSKPFSALLLGVYEHGTLRYAGKVGTGFKHSDQKEMLHLFKPLIRKESPFSSTPNYNKPIRFRPNPLHAAATWLKPMLVCEIHFTEVTEDGVFRHPAFVAMREDKDAKEVVREKELPAAKVLKREGKDFLSPSGKTQVKKVDGIELHFTNLDKVFWPEEGYTKRDMLNYYHQVAKYILPYLKNRPQSLNRFPNGIKGGSFYQKDVTGKVPEWVEKYPYKAEGDARKKHYMLCNTKAALLYMANLGAIEMNPWSSTVRKPDYPDWCILDLDPDKGNTFDQVVEVARTIHRLLDDLGVPAHCKTSGATGMHIYLPLGAKYTYEQSQTFAKWVAARANEELDFTSIERMTDKRKGRIYIDYLQNRPSATLAAPYSVRPKPGATVSMPLDWDEVKQGLSPKDFTIENAIDRLMAKGDIFKPVLGRGIDLKKLLKQL